MLELCNVLCVDVDRGSDQYNPAEAGVLLSFGIKPVRQIGLLQKDSLKKILFFLW